MDRLQVKSDVGLNLVVHRLFASPLSEKTVIKRNKRLHACTLARRAPHRNAFRIFIKFVLPCVDFAKSLPERTTFGFVVFHYVHLTTQAIITKSPLLLIIIITHW